MKHLIVILISVLTWNSCSSKKAVLDEDTLPKDISQKPHNHKSQEDEQLQMKNLINEIDSLVATESCTDPADWKFTSIGAKACGGPSSYIAYPIKLEDQVLPKVTQFTSMQSTFNTKYGLMSDCALVMPPSEIKCENGKAVLIGDHLDKEQTD